MKYCWLLVVCTEGLITPIHSSEVPQLRFRWRGILGEHLGQLTKKNRIRSSTTAVNAYPAEEPPVERSRSALEAASARGIWPRFDGLDKMILTLALPAIANFCILPLVGTVDTFFVGRIGDSSALAALGAANQVFSSVFFVVSFLPSVVTPIIAAASASGDEALLRKRVGEALWVSALVGGIASITLASFPAQALRLALPASASPATQMYASQYLATRALTLLPAMIAYVGFATFRGLLDVVTPLKVSLISQGMNVILDPIFIFVLNLGVKGAALATCVAELAAAFLYARLLALRRIINWSSPSFWRSPPSLTQLAPLLGGGAGVLSRSIAMNAAFLSVTRATQSIDPGGAAAAAHTIAMTTWQLGGVVLFALSAVASIVVPSTLNAPRQQGGGPVAAKRAAERMMAWGFLAGVGLALLQLAALPLLGLFTPVKEVADAAKGPAIIGALLQCMNGVCFCAEGVRPSCYHFLTFF